MHPAASPARRPSGPLTLADWRAAVCGGASLTQLVHERLAQAVLPGGDVAWILPPDAPAMRAHIAARLAELEALAAAAPDRRTLLAQRPLLGVPFVVKDNIDVDGLTTTAGCPAFAHTAQRSATVVRRLLQAGAVLIGKSNLDQFATGLVGTRSPYGQPVSTWSDEHVSGGSSSGSAVLVSRGVVPFALGTDTAGSGRVPAGFNHIVGLKPTPGRVSTAGVLPACRSLDCVSVFALTAADAAAVLSVLEGDDAEDDYSRFAPGA
ncbi:MAG: allophanate hydrolase, partial [Pseudomonadota bacterium]